MFLGIFKIENESYDNIEKCLKTLIVKLRNVTQIVINNQTFQIEFFGGGDLKWISNCFGINAANSSFPCPFCTFEMKELTTVEDIDQNWPNWELRNHQEANRCIGKKTVKAKKGYIKEPILDFIPFNNLVVDILHLFLRITDKLFQNLITRLQMLEDPCKIRFNSKDIFEWPFTKAFLDFVEIKCNVTAPFYIKQKDTDSKMKLRKLNQNERLSIFNNMRSLEEIFPVEIRKDMGILRFTRLFNEFKEIYQIITSTDFNKFNKTDFSVKLKNWLRDYIKIDQKITPYMHILVYHIPDFIDRHKNLNLFSMQGMEKSNHFAKINYFRQTNHHKNGFATILLEKLNRLDYIQLTSK